MRTLFVIFLALIGAGLVLYLLSRFREVWRDRRPDAAPRRIDRLDRPVRFDDAARPDEESGDGPSPPRR